MTDKTTNEGAKDHLIYDILVIGGGINGAGIARDAAGRGYSVCLCDASDFGGGTSSASTKLIHGGLRYLEHYEFRLVREALKERETLWKIAPHIIWPMRFVLPYHKGLRPAWMLRLGLFLYDTLAPGQILPGTRRVDLKHDETGAPLKSKFNTAFEYSDCWVEDSRLVILNLRDAHEHGAKILPHTRAENAHYDNGVWSAVLTHSPSQTKTTIKARTIVNAAGPWVDEVLKSVFGRNNAANVRLVRGSHIVIRKKFEHERAYIFQGIDGRVVFAIPYEHDYTLIGTTDVEHGDGMQPPKITPDELKYLCTLASDYFKSPVTSDDVAWTYSGVRPLFNDGATKAQDATRDYVIRRDKHVGEGTLINIFGGKITTYRKLAEALLDEVGSLIGKKRGAWTSKACLPGGDFDVRGFDKLVGEYHTLFSFVPKDVLARWVRLYGTQSAEMVKDAKSLGDLGEDFGHGLYEAEVRYLLNMEWAHCAEDVLFRRTKLGIRMSKEAIEHLDVWITKNNL
ncbi:MAG: glycerol-3-phosphate dehydrogenase [Hyphomicrobiales bacterium]